MWDGVQADCSLCDADDVEVVLRADVVSTATASTYTHCSVDGGKTPAVYGTAYCAGSVKTPFPARGDGIGEVKDCCCFCHIGMELPAQPSFTSFATCSGCSGTCVPAGDPRRGSGCSEPSLAQGSTVTVNETQVLYPGTITDNHHTTKPKKHDSHDYWLLTGVAMVLAMAGLAFAGVSTAKRRHDRLLIRQLLDERGPPTAERPSPLAGLGAVDTTVNACHYGGFTVSGGRIGNPE